MPELVTPKDSDWDHFWQKDKAKEASDVSWSKRRILKVIAPYVDPGKKALDAGCGSGFFSKYFIENGMATTAVDFSQGALDSTRQKTGNRARLQKAELLKDDLSKVLSGWFDVIFSDGLFEHFSPLEQDKILNNLRSVLNENGVIITFVPNCLSPWELIRPLYMPGIDEKPFTLKQLIDLSTRNHLEVIAHGGVNTLPFSVSPEGKIAEYFGMLLYTISKE